MLERWVARPVVHGPLARAQIEGRAWAKANRPPTARQAQRDGKKLKRKPPIIAAVEPILLPVKHLVAAMLPPGDARAGPNQKQSRPDCGLSTGFCGPVLNIVASILAHEPKT